MARLPRISFLLFTTLLIGFVAANCQKIICNRPHEEYQCGSACQTTCENLGETCPIINIRCNDACYCKDGYARNSNGDCIPIADCPPKSTTTTTTTRY